MNNTATDYLIEDLADVRLPEPAGDTENEGIGILVEMAKAGKINPWNIDIVDVTDKYLTHICEMKSQNLRLTGRTFLFAAVLLKLKSNILEGIDVISMENAAYDMEPVFDEDGFVADYEEDYTPLSNVISIDEVLARRASVRQNNKRVVTLKELIRHLEFYEQLEQEHSRKSAHERAKRRVQSYARLTPDDIVNLAHEEYIENCVVRLRESLVQIFTKNDRIELNELTLPGMDKISAYIALLFLTAETDYELKQDEFYSDLYVVKPPAATGGN